MSKVITNESELNTGADLITQYLNLELLALKDPADLRKFSRDFMKIDEVLTPATKSEIESILNQNLIKDVLELATEQDIRNLFVGTVLEGGETYNLSSLSTDESKVVNMRLLSLFNDLISNKFKGQTDELKTAIENLKKIQIIAGTGLKGGGSLSGNITLSLDYGTTEEVKNTLK